MKELFSKTISSPVGWLILESTESTLCAIRFSELPKDGTATFPEILLKVEEQLNEYFSGNRSRLAVELEPEGTEFQHRVWNFLLSIPYGETTTYNKIAIQFGSSTYNRAIGMANGKNPIPIIIPCHRVVGSNGKLVGYAGGLERKKQLLLHEMAHYSKGRLF